MSDKVKERNVGVERVVAKIDNDFNPDNSDWIPRVGAWCIDALSQLDALRTKRKRKKVPVSGKIAYPDCPLGGDNLKVYDENGCPVKEADYLGGKSSCCGGVSPTGEQDGSDSASAGSTVAKLTPDTVDVVDTGNKAAPNVMAETVNDKYPYRYNYKEYAAGGNGGCFEKNFVRVDDCKLELNFEAKYIFVEMDYVETVCSEKYGGCELPVIPNNGLLIEALAYYCMYKMLCRGYKHPVMNLAASQYGTNPFYLWTKLKDEAKASVNSGDAEEASHIMRSNLFIETFDPRHR